MPSRSVAVVVPEGAWKKFNRVYPEVPRSVLNGWIARYGVVEDQDDLLHELGRGVITRHNYKIDLPSDWVTYYLWPDDEGILWKEFDA